MFRKCAVAFASLVALSWTGAEPVAAHGGGGGHGGGGHGGGFGGGHFGGYGHGFYGHGFGHGFYGRGFYGYGYPFFGLGLGYGLGFGLGYGLGYGYGYGPYGYGGMGYGYGGMGMGYGGMGYGYGGYPGYGFGGGYGYGGYGPAAAGYGGPGAYPCPPAGASNSYAPPAMPRAPLNDNGTYPYNGNPANVPPLPGPTPRQLPNQPAPGKDTLSPPAAITFTAYGEEPLPTSSPARPRPIRIAYPAYGDDVVRPTVLTQTKRD